MKQAKYTSGMIPTVDDFDFEARSKNYSIEQTRFDLLVQHTTSPNDKVKGVVADSGMTPGFEDRPLMVYITTGDTVNVYSGVGYDGFERRSNRIWVPDDPSNVPLNPAAAVSNYSDIDMPDEVQTKDFTSELRPPRTVLGPNGTSRAFTAADASGAWYVCIKFVQGEYDPITLPIDGSQEDSKLYESYEIRVSQSTAADLYGVDLDPWMQLATLNWDGTELTIVSDDRVFAGAIAQLTDDLIVSHQWRYHDNAIISSDTSLLLPVIDNVNHRVNITNTSFTAQEGMNIQGSFLQDVLTPYYAQFDPTVDASNYYWIYVDYQGYIRKTTTEDTARENLPLCQVYYDQAGNEIRRNISISPISYEPFDRRHFGTITQRQLSNLILGDTWLEHISHSLGEVSDELIDHRWYQHGYGLIVDAMQTGSFIYVAGSGSLAASIAGTAIAVTDLGNDDYLYLQGREIHERIGDTQVDFAAATPGTYVVYAQFAPRTLSPTKNAYLLQRGTYSVPMSYYEYPICTVDWDGAVLDPSSLEDKRVYGSIGYEAIQRNDNAQHMNTLPQLLNAMWGSVAINANTSSPFIYFTDDWGPANPGGGGTASGRPVFPIRPLIMVYVEEAGPILYSTLFSGADTDTGTPVYGNIQGYYQQMVSNLGFAIVNTNSSPRTFYWIAIGPPFTNSVGSAIQGRKNPTYDV